MTDNTFCGEIDGKLFMKNDTKNNCDLAYNNTRVFYMYIKMGGGLRRKDCVLTTKCDIR